ncbi:hypothetical protein EII17_05570 [Clostridiales bacterium COT073_COT-073]|nr:hypothetical protein EII17_05570 [Clostridiales bacterium COT073_COT-073]
MKKRIFSMFLAVVLGIAGLNFQVGGVEVQAEEYRKGYQLKAEAEMPSGVKVSSSFILTAEKDKKLSAGEVKDKLQITPQILFETAQTEKGVRITPKEKLKENTVYAFAFEGATWLLQTENEFYLKAVLPAHQAIDVPTDTGIEFLFSTEGAEELEKYIEISPKIEGKFEQKGNLVVFIPGKRLKEKTIYTVKIKAGLPLKGSDKRLKEDRAFQFETADKPSVFGQKEDKEYLEFQTWQNEVGVGDKPIFAMSYYHFQEERPKELKVKVDLYRYASAEDYMKALSQKANLPVWANYIDGRVSKENLSRSMNIEAVLAYDEEIWGYRMELPTQVPAGYYLVEATKNKAVGQTFLQVTNISSFYQETKDKSVLWLHQVKSGKLLSGMEIISYETSDKEGKAITPKEIERVKSDKDGIALLEKKSQGPVALLIRGENMESLMFYRSWNYLPYYWKDWGFHRNHEQSDHWKILQLDRRLYQPQDKVGIFGFVMPHYEKGGNRVLGREQRLQAVAGISKVTAEVTRNYWYFSRYGSEDLAYAKLDLPVKDGFYSGQLELPNLAQGNYQLRIKIGDEILQTTYFTVEEYVKPAYKISLEKSKQAIFWNDSIDFTVKTQFFEGTPVSHLDYHYAVFGQGNQKTGQGKTDKNGQGKVNYVGQQSKWEGLTDYCHISASATLPESGEITGQDEFRVFLKDADLRAEADKKEGKGILSGDLYSISLERLNNGTAKNSNDYRDKPVAGHRLTAEIYENRWVRSETGQHYDYINKVVVKEYEWHIDKKLLEKQVLTTNDKGEFRYERALPSEENLYYTAELKTQDLSGNQIKQELYFWNRSDWKFDFEEGQDDSLRLVTDKETYRLGDMAKLSLLQGSKEAKVGKVLYITAQNGYRQAFVSGSNISLPFTEQEVPELTVLAVIFGGYAAEVAARESLIYDIEEKKLSIKATTDQESYRPGDMVKILLEVTDQKGQPAQNGKVHVKAVDEALLALADKSENILRELYRGGADGLEGSYSSHGIQQNFLQRRQRFNYMTMAKEKADAPMEAPMAMEAKEEMKRDSGNAARVREKFLDTAVFQMAELDANGKATLAFQMPDNITSWRMMMTAITADLQAGSDVHNLTVSLPFFINTTLNTAYLAGDQLSIGITGYGTQLSADTEIEYQAFVDGKSVSQGKGKAFQRINLNLPKLMAAGEKTIKIEAKAGNGLADALQYKVKVMETYQQKLVNEILTAREGMILSSSDRGLTTVIFSDREKSLYIPELYYMNYYFGHRIDQRMTAKLAGQLLKAIKGDETDINCLENVKISEYQKENGGLSIVPYGEADLDITVQMLPLLINQTDSSQDYANRRLLQAYLEAELDNQKQSAKAKIYYGLAVLRQPILDKLKAYAQIDNLSIEERLYVALAYAELGDTFRAAQIYEKYVLPKIEVYDSIASVKQGNQDKSYKLTGTAMLLAQKIDHPHALKMFTYQKDNASALYFTGAQKLNYIRTALNKVNLTMSEISYSYLGQNKTVKLDEYPVSIKLPSQKLPELKIEEVKGNVDIILSYPKAQKLATTADKYLSISRKYLVNGKETHDFKEGDIVEVRITWDIAEDAPKGSYRITDYLPAGLKAVQKDFSIGGYYNDYYWWWQDIEGQKVSTYVRRWKDSTEKERTYSYYARIVSLGEFKAEGILMQNMDVLDHVLVGADERIKIGE